VQIWPPHHHAASSAVPGPTEQSGLTQVGVAMGVGMGVGIGCAVTATAAVGPTAGIGRSAAVAVGDQCTVGVGAAAPTVAISVAVPTGTVAVGTALVTAGVAVGDAAVVGITNGVGLVVGAGDPGLEVGTESPCVPTPVSTGEDAHADIIRITPRQITRKLRTLVRRSRAAFWSSNLKILRAPSRSRDEGFVD
jgi:hypothetical protein